MIEKTVGIFIFQTHSRTTTQIENHPANMDRLNDETIEIIQSFLPSRLPYMDIMRCAEDFVTFLQHDPRACLMHFAVMATLRTSGGTRKYDTIMDHFLHHDRVSTVFPTSFLDHEFSGHYMAMNDLDIVFDCNADEWTDVQDTIIHHSGQTRRETLYGYKECFARMGIAVTFQLSKQGGDWMRVLFQMADKEMFDDRALWTTNHVSYFKEKNNTVSDVDKVRMPVYPAKYLKNAIMTKSKSMPFRAVYCAFNSENDRSPPSEAVFIPKRWQESLFYTVIREAYASSRFCTSALPDVFTLLMMSQESVATFFFCTAPLGFNMMNALNATCMPPFEQKTIQRIKMDGDFESLTENQRESLKSNISCVNDHLVPAIISTFKRDAYPENSIVESMSERDGSALGLYSLDFNMYMPAAVLLKTLADFSKAEQHNYLTEVVTRTLHGNEYTFDIEHFRDALSHIDEYYMFPHEKTFSPTISFDGVSSCYKGIPCEFEKLPLSALTAQLVGLLFPNILAPIALPTFVPRLTPFVIRNDHNRCYVETNSSFLIRDSAFFNRNPFSISSIQDMEDLEARKRQKVVYDDAWLTRRTLKSKRRQDPPSGKMLGFGAKSLFTHTFKKRVSIVRRRQHHQSCSKPYHQIKGSYYNYEKELLYPLDFIA